MYLYTKNGGWICHLLKFVKQLDIKLGKDTHVLSKAPRIFVLGCGQHMHAFRSELLCKQCNFPHNDERFLT